MSSCSSNSIDSEVRVVGLYIYFTACTQHIHQPRTLFSLSVQSFVSTQCVFIIELEYILSLFLHEAPGGMPGGTKF